MMKTGKMMMQALSLILRLILPNTQLPKMPHSIPPQSELWHFLMGHMILSQHSIFSCKKHFQILMPGQTVMTNLICTSVQQFTNPHSLILEVQKENIGFVQCPHTPPSVHMAYTSSGWLHWTHSLLII